MKTKSNIACFDSHVFIWGVKKEATPGQEHNIAKTAYFIEHLENNGVKIIMPAPVLTELTYRLNEDERNKFAQTVNKRFICAPFDNACGLICAKILHKLLKEGRLKEDITRKKIKYDALIASIAIRHECDCLYTLDKDYDAIREFIEIKEIPNLTRTLELNFKAE